MEPQGYVRVPPSHASKDGSSKPTVPQKNAYARLVQKHHSGRFRSYLNHIAQKLQLEEASALNDSDTEPSLKRGLVREALSKNGVKTPSGSLVKTLHPVQLEFGRAEQLSDSREAASAKRQHHQSDPSAGRSGDDEVVDEEDGVSAHQLEDLSAASRGRQVLGQGVLSRQSGFQQKTTSSGERDREEPWRSKYSRDAPATFDRSDGYAPTGHFSMDVPTTNARKTSPFSPSQVHGTDKRGVVRTRNKSESGRAPPSVDRRRQLSESQVDTMSGSDCRMTQQQPGTPRGGSHTTGSTPGERKNRSKPTRGRKKIFEAYLSQEDVSAGLKRKTLIQVLGT